MASIDGLQVVQQVASLAPGTRTLIVTSVADKDQVISALKVGASREFHSKNASPEMLMRAVHGVLQGESWVDRASVALLLEGPARRVAPRRSALAAALVGLADPPGIGNHP